MMRKPIFFSFLFFVTFQTMFGQSPVLFRFGNEVVRKAEFERVFMKNNQKDKKPDAQAIEEYLQLYINFKLKVMEAKSLGMDTMTSFRTELEGYRKQLAQPYLTDKNVTEALIREAYERGKWEINASHILVLCEENALPKDTLSAYTKVVEIRKKIMNGEIFDSVAFKFSEDQSAKYNNGNLGYFTVFNLIYSFESMAYNTPTGSVSPIFRTRFGYHILKVNDKREARHDIKVSHIMLKFPKTKQNTEQVRLRVDSLYSRLISGASFEELAKQYSEDEGTARNGGVLNYITSIGGPWPVEFKEAAFKIQNINGISKPVETQYGWHIIKLLEKKTPPIFDDIKDQLKQKVSRDQRSEVNKNAVIDRIKTEYKVVINSGAAEKFYYHDSSNLNKDLAAGKWISDAFKASKTQVLKIGDRIYTENDFSDYIKNYQTPRQRSSVLAMVIGMFKEFVSQKCIEYEEARLEEKYEDFRNLYQEYREGILLFELMDKKVWTKAMTDSIGLKEFYENNMGRYMWKDRVDAQIFETHDVKIAKKIKKMLKKGLDNDSILRVVNKENPLNVTGKSGKYEKGENLILDSLGWTKGVNIYTSPSGKIYIVNINDIIPACPKKIIEARGVITADYQSFLEKRWIEELKNKYPVKVDDQVKAGLFR